MNVSVVPVRKKKKKKKKKKSFYQFTPYQCNKGDKDFIALLGFCSFCYVVFVGSGVLLLLLFALLVCLKKLKLRLIS